MTLFDMSVDLQLKLEVAQSADSSADLIARAARLFETLDASATYFEGVLAIVRTMGYTDRPSLDVKAVAQAVSAFRRGISQHGSAAFQHQPATTLAETAKAQRDRCGRWVSSRWREEFAALDPLINRVGSEPLAGRGIHAISAQARAQSLRAARTLDPIGQQAEINAALGVSDVGSWRTGIIDIGERLSAALASLDAEHAALTSEVRAVLERASSAEGMPLDHVSTEMLEALRRAGVDGQLVLRRR